MGRKGRINNYPVMEMGEEEIDEDLFKLDKLSYINASARYELMSAKEQLMKFKLQYLNKDEAKDPLRTETAEEAKR